MKPLRRHLVLLPMLAAAAACTAEKDISIVVTAARAPGDTCGFTDPTLYVEGGAIDMSVFGPASSYFQVFSWESQLQQISTTVNGDTIASSQANTFIANRVQLSYILVGGTNPPNGLINMSATIVAGATPDKNSVGVELLTPEAAQAGNTATLAGGSQTLLVTFQIAGNLVSGASSMTNPITYPLTLFRSGYDAATNTCPPGETTHVTSCNIPGRDIPYCSF
jgi:hypothetical protein